MIPRVARRALVAALRALQDSAPVRSVGGRRGAVTVRSSLGGMVPFETATPARTLRLRRPHAYGETAADLPWLMAAAALPGAGIGLQAGLAQEQWRDMRDIGVIDGADYGEEYAYGDELHNRRLDAIEADLAEAMRFYRSAGQEGRPRKRTRGWKP